MKKLQDAPIPSDVKQDEKLSTIEARLNGIEDDLEYLKRIMYKGD
jgi:archaellum component FlaC